MVTPLPTHSLSLGVLHISGYGSSDALVDLSLPGMDRHDQRLDFTPYGSRGRDGFYRLGAELSWWGDGWREGGRKGGREEGRE